MHLLKWFTRPNEFRIMDRNEAAMRLKLEYLKEQKKRLELKIKDLQDELKHL